MPSRSVTIAGDKAIDKALRGFAPALAKQLLRSSLRQGAKVLAVEAAKEAPRGKTRVLSKSIKVRAARRSRKGVVALLVRTAAGDFKGKSYYGSFVEFGTKGRRPGKRGGGPIRARHFMRNAVARKKEAARKVAITALRESIAKAARDAKK